MDLKEITLRLILAVIVAAVIGFDRELKNRPAGLRTHILVCVGATVIAMIQMQLVIDAVALDKASQYSQGAIGVDPARLICQVVSGIGFLGAGTIIVTHRSIKGLTTAASLWATAGIGIAIGMGYYTIAVLGFAVILLTLSFIQKIIRVPSLKKIEIQYLHRVETKEMISEYFDEKGVEVRDVDFDVEFHTDYRIYKNVYTVELPHGLSYVELIEDFSIYKNIVKVRLITV